MCSVLLPECITDVISRILWRTANIQRSKVYQRLFISDEYRTAKTYYLYMEILYRAWYLKLRDCMVYGTGTWEYNALLVGG